MSRKNPNGRNFSGGVFSCFATVLHRLTMSAPSKRSNADKANKEWRVR